MVPQGDKLWIISICKKKYWARRIKSTPIGVYPWSSITAYLSNHLSQGKIKKYLKL